LDFHFTEFSEVRIHGVLGSSKKEEGQGYHTLALLASSYPQRAFAFRRVVKAFAILPSTRHDEGIDGYIILEPVKSVRGAAGHQVALEPLTLAWITEGTLSHHLIGA
jgi:hypothetical protein